MHKHMLLSATLGFALIAGTALAQDASSTDRNPNALRYPDTTQTYNSPTVVRHNCERTHVAPSIAVPATGCADFADSDSRTSHSDADSDTGRAH